MSAPPLIVVGVDGSDDAVRALRWAVTRARLLGARVLAVQAWSSSAVAAMAEVMTSEDVEEVTTLVAQELERTVASVADLAALDPPVAIETRAQQGPAAHVLVHEARAAGASLLVVGSRGHGGFAALLLGSVSTTLARHAPCPLVIVPRPHATA